MLALPSYLPSSFSMKCFQTLQRLFRITSRNPRRRSGEAFSTASKSRSGNDGQPFFPEDVLQTHQKKYRISEWMEMSIKRTTSGSKRSPSLQTHGARYGSGHYDLTHLLPRRNHRHVQEASTAAYWLFCGAHNGKLMNLCHLPDNGCRTAGIASANPSWHRIWKNHC